MLRAGHARVLQGRRGRHGHRPPPHRHAVAGDRRQGGRLERRRHADAAAARPAARAAPRQRPRTSASSASAAASRSAPRSPPARSRRADIVEISPEVVEASRFFDRENGRALATPGVRLIVGDGRSHLLLTPQRYDVIVSEPSNPWMAGVAALFTREFFEAARARLKPDGLLCQWAHTYDISSETICGRSCGRSHRCFRRARCGWSAKAICCSSARTATRPISLERLDAAWRIGGVPSALEDVGISRRPDAIRTPVALRRRPARSPAIRRRRARSRPTTAWRSSSRRRAASTAGRRARTAQRIRALAVTRPPAVKSAFDRATDASWTARGTMELKAEAYGLAYRILPTRRRAECSRTCDALAGLSQAAAPAPESWTKNCASLKSLGEADPRNAAVRIELSRVLAVGRRFPGRASPRRTMRCASRPTTRGRANSSPRSCADAGDGDRLAPLADRLVARFPDARRPALLPGHRAVSARPGAAKRAARSGSWSRSIRVMRGAEPARRRVRDPRPSATAQNRPSSVDPSESARCVDVRQPRDVLLADRQSSAAGDCSQRRSTIDPRRRRRATGSRRRAQTRKTVDCYSIS